MDHSQGECIDNLISQISKLKTSVSDWKNAWFELRDVIGNLWWNHPAILDDQQRAYYQAKSRNKHG